MFLERIEGLRLLVRGQEVMLNADLAAIYGVGTRALVQAVKRNLDRFHDDFMFQLTQGRVRGFEITKCDHKIEDLVALIPANYQAREVDWGEPVGKEAW